MLRHVALVRTDVSEELSASFIRVTVTVTASVVPRSPILVTLLKEALSSSETSVFTRATRRNIPEDSILHRHRLENLKSYNQSRKLALALVSTAIFGYDSHGTLTALGALRQFPVVTQRTIFGRFYKCQISLPRHKRWAGLININVGRPLTSEELS
jgi:hypothetical protein